MRIFVNLRPAIHAVAFVSLHSPEDFQPLNLMYGLHFSRHFNSFVIYVTAHGTLLSQCHNTRITQTVSTIDQKS